MSRVITVSFPGGKKVDARLEDRTVRTDQPVEAGGEGSAPAPFDLFLASLAACAGYYALEFCQARQLSTEGLGVALTADRDPAAKLYTRMRIEVKLPAGFPEKYRDAVLRAVDLCAVKKHILNAPTFEVAVV